MALEDIVNVQITAQSKTPTRPGFGTPLIMAAKVPVGPFTGSLVQQYGSLTEMTDAGFLVSDPAYRAATAIFSQNPRVKRLKVGKRSLPFTKTITLECLTAVEGAKYSITLKSTTITYTVPAAATTTSVATAIDGLIDAGTGTHGFTSTNAGAVLTLTQAAGVLSDVSDWSATFRLADTTADPGIATDLAAVFAEDSDWYGLVLDSNSKLEVQAAATWVEANKRIAVWDTSDTVVLDPGTTTDVASNLKASSYVRSMPLFSSNKMLSYAGAALMGNRFPFSPGSDTWAFKTLAGVPASKLTDGQITAAIAKNCSVYTAVAGLVVTQFGRSSGGEWMDVTRFIDWLTAEIKVRVFQLLVNAQKIPYTDAGVDAVVSVIKGALADGINVGGLAASPEPAVDAPLVADVNLIDRGNRNLPDIQFTGRLAGAIHSLEISGTLSI